MSVLCPVYDGERHLRESVASIRGQSFADWELILLDDGSRDASPRLCAELARGDGRIRFERHPENRGLGAAMTTLCRLARGLYLAVQEQDDVSSPRRLEQEVAVLEREPEVGLVSGIAEWLDAEGRSTALFPGLLARSEAYPEEPADMVRFLYLEQCKVVNAGCMFRRAVLEDPRIRFDPEARMSVDWQFFLHLAHRWRIHGLNEVVVRMHRGHPTLTRRKELQFREARRCLHRIRDTYAGDPESPITGSLYRQALAYQLVLEGRHRGRLRGLGLLGRAALLHPTSAAPWRSMADLAKRAWSRLASGTA